MYFGALATHRFDAPDRSFGTLYVADDLATGLMETVFHGHRWARSRRRTVAALEIERRLIRVIGLRRRLILADLTAPDVLAPVLGLTLSQFSSRAYRHTQRVALQVYQGGTSGGLPLDGVRYPSHNNFPRACYVLFERSAEALHVANDIALPDHGDWPAFLTKYQVAVV